MRYSIRSMSEADIPQVAEIDREAFPTQWPFSPYQYRRELNNKLATHVVAVKKGGAWQAPKNGSRSMFNILNLILGRNNRAETAPVDVKDLIAGFAGVWRMLDEAHLTTIAVKKDARGLGVGELLLLAAFDIALNFGAHVVTLEVRASNTVAQELYKKYGFAVVGLRRGYYSEDGEDALIMTTDPIETQAFQEKLTALREQHTRRMRELAVSPTDAA